MNPKHTCGAASQLKPAGVGRYSMCCWHWTLLYVFSSPLWLYVGFACTVPESLCLQGLPLHSLMETFLCMKILKVPLNRPLPKKIGWRKTGVPEEKPWQPELNIKKVAEGWGW